MFLVLGEGSLEDLAVSAVSVWEEPSRGSVLEMGGLQGFLRAAHVLIQLKAWRRCRTGLPM